MRQSFLYGFFATCFLFLFVSSIQAQVTGWNSYCVDFKRCGNFDDSDWFDNDVCNPIGDDAVHTSTHWGHRVSINVAANTYAPNSKIYITECIHNFNIDLDGNSTADIVCTTGNSVLDIELFCGGDSDLSSSCDRLSILKGKDYDLNKHGPTGDYGVFHLIAGKYTRMPNPPSITTNASGAPAVATLEWQAYTPYGQDAERSYVIWEPFISQNATPTPTGSVGGQQQGTVAFPTPTQTQATQCKTGSWDPYGRVFDTVSLEPIPAAAVSLEQRKPDGTFDAGFASQNNLHIINPFESGLSGKFSFFVINGDYQLRPSKSGYVHPVKAFRSTFLPLASQMYSDFYFNDSPAIQERGSIVHVDIPMQPIDGVGKSYDLVIFSEEFTPTISGKVTYSGMVSHPFAKLVIEICSEKTGTAICNPHNIFDVTTGGPNKEGAFSITLDQTILQAGEYFQRSFIKALSNPPPQTRSVIDTILAFIIKPVQAQEFTGGEAQPVAKIQPLPTYLEGYAYDLKGNILQNAQIQLYISTTSIPIYTSQSDANGFFRIGSEHIPRELYTVKYVSTEGVITPITTSQLLAQNEEFIAAEEVDIYTTAKGSANPRNNITPAFQPQQKISALPITPQVAPVISDTPSSEETKGTNNPLYLVGAILLLLVGGAGALIALHIYRKRSMEPTDM